jgi:hypothetical protein
MTQRVKRRAQKKPGSNEPGLRYWPREADTITFQEGLLSFRATGGGGHMRNANAQRRNIMSRVAALQQPPTPHVRHAETGGCDSEDQDGQRCALLTTKSRNTCTRATVFNSSG